jgi:DNA invertase Pin-like site-specific DNA recombinase
MLIGYARVSKADGSQTLDLQQDALTEYGIALEKIYADKASGSNINRPEFESCLKALRKGDTLVVWKLDRLGRNMKDLVTIINDLSDKGIHFKVLAGQGAEIDTGTPAGRMIFGIFASLAEYERDLIRERIQAGLKAARARGRRGGRKPAFTKAKLKLAQQAMKDRSTIVSELCKELGVSPMTLYRYISPKGELRAAAVKLLKN